MPREPRRICKSADLDVGSTTAFKVECFVLDASPTARDRDRQPSTSGQFVLALVAAASEAAVLRSGLAPGPDLRSKFLP